MPDLAVFNKVCVCSGAIKIIATSNTTKNNVAPITKGLNDVCLSINLDKNNAFPLKIK
jgi:hypothetical protein